MKSIWQIRLRARLTAAGLIEDCRGIAATEFGLIVPIMLVMFFGTVEFSSGMAVNRKVALMARTLADLTSQSLSVADSDGEGRNYAARLAYARPRQSLCVFYPTTSPLPASCPVL
jgi:Flp pilus assembly protein TadG